MSKRSLAILFCLLIAVPVTAQGLDMEVRPADKELLEAKPREIVTTAFRVTNYTSEQYEFVSDVELPQGWTLITEDFPFFLSPNESCTKPVSFFVPEITAAGRYKITYLVKARRYPSIRDFYTIEVMVLQHSKLEVRLMQAPRYAIAGQDCQVRFQVANKSNMENSVSVDIDSSENIPFTVDSREFRLAPGQVETVTVTIEPDAKITKILKLRLQLTARIVGDSESKTQAKAAHLIEIVPGTGAVEERFGTVAPQIVIGQLSKKTKEVESKPYSVPSCAKTSTQQRGEHLQSVPAAEEKPEDKLLATGSDLPKKKMWQRAMV
jgi:hypothetical protein